MEPLADAVRLFRSTREWIAPVLTSSAFLERGVLTPEEFVRAGDHLVQCCPSWTWCEGETSKIKSYLPKQKQFLLTRGVPCFQRVAKLYSISVEEKVEKGDEIGDWEVPTLQNQQVDLSSSNDVSQENNNVNAIGTTSKEDEYLDMEDESLALDDSTTAMPSSSSSSSSNAVGSSSTPKSSNYLKSRRYDISMTYDKYYQTPRIWLFGYDENGSPLSNEAVFEDIISDYAKKTVTIDPHPHLTHYHASIHPCQHGPAMKNLLSELVDGGQGQVPDVNQYIFVFLKFIQSVIPTIEYDYTVDVKIGKVNN